MGPGGGGGGVGVAVRAVSMVMSGINTRIADPCH